MSLFAYLYLRTNKQYVSHCIFVQVFFLANRTFSGMPESASLYKSYLWLLFRAGRGGNLRDCCHKHSFWGCVRRYYSRSIG